MGWDFGARTRPGPDARRRQQYLNQIKWRRSNSKFVGWELNENNGIQCGLREFYILLIFDIWNTYFWYGHHKILHFNYYWFREFVLTGHFFAMVRHQQSGDTISDYCFAWADKCNVSRWLLGHVYAFQISNFVQILYIFRRPTDCMI